MSYVAPSTRSTGNLITAAIWNQDIRDNRNFLHNCPAAQVYRTTNQTISDSALTGISWDAEVFDTEGIHDPVTNPDRLVVQTAGVYFVHAMVKFASGGASRRELWINVNDVASHAANAMRIGSTAAAEMSISMAFLFNVNWFVILRVFQTSGGPLDIVSDGTFRPRFGICWIGSGV